MLKNIFFAEIFKYKRTLIPWLIIIGGFFPAMVALLFIMTGDLPATWESFLLTGFSFLNMLALLLVAVIAGNSVVFEYHDGKTNIIHTYPMPRLLQYLSKLFVVLLMIVALHLVFVICIFVFGWIFAENELSGGFAMKILKLTFLTAAANYMLAPLTAAISIAIKNVGAYILAGVGYFIVYMSFAGADCAKYVPPCVPDIVLKQYILTGKLPSAEAANALIFTAVVFLLVLCIGAVLYSRLEI